MIDLVDEETFSAKKTHPTSPRRAHPTPPRPARRIANREAPTQFRFAGHSHAPECDLPIGTRGTNHQLQVGGAHAVSLYGVQPRIRMRFAHR